ncbi:flagellar biosynthetic protein FliR [uncultured Maritimibacter sp.]|jgi:flagellar biosynthetic protein FliR|uniref:flagellar biosynthetic protein FliR n=1 Tax=uncultured Maritimibacter sp. TaxID=991866 RepID=UPI000AD8F545|nr:flagellar biosynthetic protein FliR [uncultured Maritimibacter sp.]
MTEIVTRFLDLVALVSLPALGVFLRVGSAMALLPVFGERVVPARVRLTLALCFTAIVAPAVSDGFARAATTPGLPLWLGAEVLAGLLIGIMVRLYTLALQTAGAIIAQSTSLSQILGNAVAEPAPAIGHLLLIAGLALATLTDLHVQVASVFIQSYGAIPAGTLPTASATYDWVLPLFLQSFALAFALAAPFVIASLIYNIVMGVINRAMPQLMVSFVGAPAITFGGLLLLALITPLLLEIWNDALTQVLSAPFGGAP